MTRVFRTLWVVLIWLFAVMIPIQFYLAGHGAMEGAHSADKSIPVMSSAWDPHAIFGTFMALVALLVLLAALPARLPRVLLGHSAGLFLAMVIQFILPFFNDSVSTRWLAAFHAVNALVVTGLAASLVRLSLPYRPGQREPDGVEAAAPAGGGS